MSNPSDEAPIEQANEADVAEQAQEADGAIEDDAPEEATLEEDAYPHQAEGEVE